MISFHRDIEHVGDARRYSDGFEPANIDEVDRIALGISRFPWSGIQWLGGRRAQRHFGRAAWCVLDFDDGALSLPQAVNIFSDSVHVIGTTRSHQKEKKGLPPCDRFRVLLKFEQPIEDLETYRATMAYYIDRHGADPSCVDGARFFWPCVEIVSMQADGFAQEICTPVAYEPRDYSVYREMKTMPRWIEGILKFGCGEGYRNTTCYKLGVHLTHCGFSTNEIVDLIAKSPIYLSLDEITRAVLNGARRGMEEMANGQATEES